MVPFVAPTAVAIEATGEGASQDAGPAANTAAEMAGTGTEAEGVKRKLGEEGAEAFDVWSSGEPPYFGRTKVIAYDNPEQEKQHFRCERLFTLAVEMVAAKSWQSLFYAETCPDAFAGIYHKDNDERAGKMKWIKEEWMRLERAIEASNNDDHPHVHLVRSTLADARRFDTQLVFEWISIAKKCNWSHDAVELLHETYLTFGGLENTKKGCEDIFAELRDAERDNKNSKASHVRAHFLAATQPTKLQGTGLKAVKLEPDDWAGPDGTNYIPDGMVNDNIFSGLYHEMHPDMRASLMNMPGDKCVPPTGLKAERRTLSALAALRSSVEDDFLLLENSWLARLLPSGLVFERTDQDYVFMSFGASDYAALGWRMRSKTVGVRRFLYMQSDIRPDPLVWQADFVVEDGVKLPQLRGIPCAIVPPMTMPKHLRRTGLCLEQVGEPMPLLHFVLLSGKLRVGENITNNHIKQLLSSLHAVVPKGTKMNQRNLCQVLVTFALQGFTTETRRRVLDDLCRAPHEDCDDDTIAAIDALDPDTKQDFKDFRETATCHKSGYTFERGPTIHRTPLHLRMYVPWRGHQPGCFLHRSNDRHFFTGFYPGSGSLSRTWGGMCNRTEEYALELVLSWMWEEHTRCHPKEVRPTDRLAPPPPDISVELKSGKASSKSKVEGKAKGKATGKGKGLSLKAKALAQKAKKIADKRLDMPSEDTAKKIPSGKGAKKVQAAGPAKSGDASGASG